MSQEIDLKAAERKAYRLSTSQDGLHDTFIGLFIVLLSIMPWLDENGMRTPWNVVLVLALGLLIQLGVLAAKKFVVAPRIGRVQYGVDRKKRMKHLAIGMGTIFLLTVAIFVLTISAIYFREPAVQGPLQSGLPFDIVHTGAGIFIIAIFSLLAYMNDHPRLYLYGWLFGIGYVVSTYIQDQTGSLFYWPWAIAGILVAIIGAILFSLFLKKYPIPVDSVPESSV
jgi:MFS family permease